MIGAQKLSPPRPDSPVGKETFEEGIPATMRTDASITPNRFGAQAPVQIGLATLWLGDCLNILATLAPESVDSCVCDPPYHLSSIVKRFGATNAAPAKAGKTGAYARASRGFMGQQWDGGDIAFRPETWAAVFRVLKPGAHLIAFSGTRTYHRMVCAIEDAGFEIRDQLAWVYGSGFPKSHDVSKQIDKAAGNARGTRPDFRNGPNTNNASKGDKYSLGYAGQSDIDAGPVAEDAQKWQGWGTALKPAWEPICLARKPLQGTVAANVLEHGAGALNIDGCRVETGEVVKADHVRNSMGYNGGNQGSIRHAGDGTSNSLGRWPANIIHDGSDEVLAHFPDTGVSSGGRIGNAGGGAVRNLPTGTFSKGDPGFGDSGSAARFFYCAKTSASERHAGCEDLPDGRSNHPTVKPVALMRWLTRLVTPKGGLVLDPFAGSGSTLIAASWEGFRSVGCELSPEYVDIAQRRLTAAQAEIDEATRQLTMLDVA